MDSSEEQTAEEVYEWLRSSSNSSTPKQNANLNLIHGIAIALIFSGFFTNTPISFWYLPYDLFLQSNFGTFVSFARKNISNYTVMLNEC